MRLDEKNVTCESLPLPEKPNQGGKYIIARPFPSLPADVRKAEEKKAPSEEESESPSHRCSIIFPRLVVSSSSSSLSIVGTERSPSVGFPIVVSLPPSPPPSSTHCLRHRQWTTGPSVHLPPFHTQSSAQQPVKFPVYEYRFFCPGLKAGDNKTGVEGNERGMHRTYVHARTIWVFFSPSSSSPLIVCTQTWSFGRPKKGGERGGGSWSPG